MRTSPTQPLALPAALRLLRQGEFPLKLGVCDRLFKRYLASGGICWVRTVPGLVWKLDLANPTHRWIVYGDYEGPAFWRWLRAHSNAFHTIADSGANIGQTVLNFAAITSKALVYAYEPGAHARAWLTECVAANSLDQVAIYPTGLGSETVTARLAADGEADRHGSWNKVSMTEGEPISIVTLDDELDRLGIATLDLWKLDMEGYEGFALRGAARSLAAGRIRVIYIEAAGEPGRDSLAFLAARGYRIYHILSSGRLAALTAHHDYENALCLAPDESAFSA